jgi:hypothetical protein
MIRQYAFLLDKSALQPAVVMGGERTLVEIAVHGVNAAAQPLSVRSDAPPSVRPELVEGFRQAQPERNLESDAVAVPLIQLAYARSGDKGDTSNIGIIARQPAFLPYIKAAVTEQTVANWLVHLVKGKVTRFDLPGINAVNFVCEQALGGGGMSSLRNDPLGKGMAQMVLDMQVQIPAKLL